MRSFCSICSDLFDELKPISATQCGHTFHSNCLLKWMDQSKTCPVCRCTINIRKLLPLYFNNSPNDSINTTYLENELDSLKAEIIAKNKEIEEQKKTIDEIRSYVKKAEIQVEDLRQINFQLERELSTANLNLKSMNKLENKVQKLEQRNLALSNDIEQLNDIKLMISGTQKDVQDILNRYGTGVEASKNLAILCTFLKRELCQVIDQKQRDKNEISNLKKNLGCRSLDLKKAKDEINELNNQIKSLEKENIILSEKDKNSRNNISDCSLDTPKASILYESPTPERHKKPLNENFEITPITKVFENQINKRKFEILNKDTIKISEPPVTSIKLPSFKSIKINKENDENSIVRNGYNGLGGHSKFIVKSSIVDKKYLKKK